VVEPLQDLHPVREGTVAHIDILPQRVQGQGGAHSLGKEIGQQLQGGEVTHGLQVTHVLPEESIEVFLLPAAEGASRLGEEGLRKPPELKKRVEEVWIAALRQTKLLARGERGNRSRGSDLGIGEGVEAVVMVAPLKRVPPRR
jgi:hypothetical protein